MIIFSKRRFFVIVTVALLVLVAVIGCGYLLTNQVHRSKLPVQYPIVQGLYESCSPARGSICLDRLKQMAAAGFKLVINYDQLYGTEKQELAYAQQANTLDIKVIWGMSDPVFWNGSNLISYYDDLASTCNCSDNNGFLRYVVDLVKNLPATWGYYVGDEVKSSDHAKMKIFADLIKKLDPSHPRLFISGEDSSTMGSNLEPFADTADVIGADTYPVDTSEPTTIVGDIARAIQSIADRNGKQSVLVLQAFSWAQYPHSSWVCSPFPGCARFPTMDEMRQMRDLALTNSHPQFLLWYSYFDIFRSDHPSLHWHNLIQAAGVKGSSSR